VTQEVEYLPSKAKALNSNSSTTKNGMNRIHRDRNEIRPTKLTFNFKNIILHNKIQNKCEIMIYAYKIK
jgi:hypothetical protein